MANASHKLRTPLSIIRTEVDVTLADPDATVDDLQAMAVRVRSATERSEHLIGSLLVLAKSDRGLADSEALPLDQVVAEAAGQVTGEAAAADVELRMELGPVRVAGDRHLLERLAGNLIENAIRYNHPGGRVDLSLFPAGSVAVLRVSNTGPTVPTDRVEELFEPFRRLAAERTSADQRGVGLGLSIVRSVAVTHGGVVGARPRADGGLEVEVQLPLTS